MSADPKPPVNQPVLSGMRQWVRSLPVIGPLWQGVRGRMHARKVAAAEIHGVGEPWMKLLALPEFKIFVDRGDGLIGKTIAESLVYEPHVTAVLRRLLRPSQGFLDIGANIGFHALLAARRVGRRGRVIAVEMMPRNCELLRASVAVNGFQNVTLHQVAAVETAQTVTFTHGEGTGNGMLVSDYVQGLADAGHFSSFMTVQAVAIDDLLPATQPIHVIKMDIEGAEMRALQGMERLLRTQRPRLVFEFYPHVLRHIGGIEPVALLQAIRAHGYDIAAIDRNGGALSGSLTDSQVMAQVESATEQQYLDLLAAPAS